MYNTMELPAIDKINHLPPGRLLVLGGGGCRGAWAGGFAHFLRLYHNIQYRYIWSTSSGSLIAPFIITDDFARLKKLYTGLTQKSIFDVNPFTTSGNLNGWVALWRILRGKKTLGETHNLRKLIQTHITRNKYLEIIQANPQLQFTVCAVNYKNAEVVHKQSGTSVPYEEMVNWIWASANQPLFMTCVDEQYLPGGSFIDGGIIETIPIVHALKYAADHGIFEIDIIINTPREPIADLAFKPGNMLKNLLRVIELWKRQVQKDNIDIARLLSQQGLYETDPLETGDDGWMHLYCYYFPPAYYPDNFNELLFNKTKMTALWAAGENGEHEKNKENQLNTKDLQPVHYRIPLSLLKSKNL